MPTASSWKTKTTDLVAGTAGAATRQGALRRALFFCGGGTPRGARHPAVNEARAFGGGRRQCVPGESRSVHRHRHRRGCRDVVRDVARSTSHRMIATRCDAIVPALEGAAAAARASRKFAQFGLRRAERVGAGAVRRDRASPSFALPVPRTRRCVRVRSRARAVVRVRQRACAVYVRVRAQRRRENPLVFRLPMHAVDRVGHALARHRRKLKRMARHPYRFPFNRANRGAARQRRCRIAHRRRGHVARALG